MLSLKKILTIIVINTPNFNKIFSVNNATRLYVFLVSQVSTSNMKINHGIK